MYAVTKVGSYLKDYSEFSTVWVKTPVEGLLFASRSVAEAAAKLVEAAVIEVQSVN